MIVAEKDAAMIKGAARQRLAAMKLAPEPRTRLRTRPRFSPFVRSLCQDARELEQFRIYRLDASNDLCERRSRDLVLLIADQYAGLTIAQGLDGSDAQPGSQQAIEGAGWCAAHDVPRVWWRAAEACPLLICVEITKDFGRIFFDAFGNHHDRMRLAALECGAQPLRDLACRRLGLGGRDSFCAARETCQSRQISAISAMVSTKKRGCVRNGRA